MKTHIFLFLGLLSLSLVSCKKQDTSQLSAAGGINVTNAVVGGSMITMITNNSIGSGNNTVSANNYNFMPLAYGQVQIFLGVPAVAASATTAAVPAIPYYTNTLAVDNSTNYSLFLTGASPAAIDNVLIKENYTRTYADSVCGVRFINLSPGSNPISVNVQGKTNGSEVQSLAYKSYSGFIQHPAQKANAAYTFEVRDAASGSIITTFKLSTPLFHNVTLCLRGPAGGSVGVLQVNDF